MNTLSKFIFAAAAVMTLSASAQDIQASTPYSAYVQDGRGVIVRNPFGLCWRTGYWTPADAVAGCDGPLTITCTPPQVAVGRSCITPPVEAEAPAPTPAPAPAPAPAPRPAPAAPTAEKVTFQADALFDFNKAVLKPEGKAKIDDLASKLKSINLEVIIATGHTDGIGSDAYNQKLSEKRAAAVKAYMVSKGIDEKRIFTEGKGKKQPVADNKTDAGRAKNRRVEIEVVGTRN
jgi:OmpA-OmpF porin, OOP family